MQLKLDNAMEDVNNKYLALEMAEKNAVRTKFMKWICLKTLNWIDMNQIQSY